MKGGALSNIGKIEERNKLKIIADVFISAIILFVSVLTIFFLVKNPNLVKYIDIPVILIAQIMEFVGLLLCILFLSKRYPVDYTHVGFQKGKLEKNILLGVIGGLLISFLQFPYGVLFGRITIPSFMYVKIHEGFFYVAVYLLMDAFIIPIIEEILFRGYLYRILRAKLGISWGVIITTPLFVVLHFPSSIKIMIELTISSLIVIYLYEKSKFLGPSILAHVFGNITWSVAVYCYDLF